MNLKFIYTGILTLALSLASLPVLAATRYADATLASDCSGSTYSIASRNCTGSDGTGHKTAASALTATTAGDTVYFRAGTWTVRWDLTGKGGTANNYTTIAGYPGETVTYAPTYVYDQNSNFLGFNTGTRPNWLIIQDLVIDGINAPSTSPQLNDVKGWYMAGVSNVIIRRNEIKRWHYSAIHSTGGSNITIQNNLMHDQVSTCTAGDRWYGTYLHDGDNFLVEGNDVYNNPGGGMQVYPNPTNVTIRRNKIHNNNTCSNGASGVGGIIVQQDLSLGGAAVINVKIYENLIYNNGVAGSGLSYGIKNNNVTGTQIYNNTIYGNHNYGIGIGDNSVGGSVNTLVKNNILYQNVPDDTVFIFANSTGTVATNNSTTDPSFTNAGAADFTLTAASNAINTGVDVGLAFNGSAPEKGAFEAMAFAACTVENATPSKLSITFTNNRDPPLLPATGVTGFTSRKAGSNNVITGAVRTGTNQIDLTLTNAIVNGNTVDISYTGSGNLTDSVLIGNSANQSYKTVLTNQSCTNNVGASLTYVLSQAAFAWHGLRGTESAPINTPYATAPESTNIVAVPGAQARLRISLTCTTADCPSLGFIPYYSRNAGSYTVLPDVYSADNVAFCGTSPDSDIPISGTATTNQLSTSGVFVAGALIRTSNAIPTITLTTGKKTENEYCIAFSPSVAVGDTFDFRVRRQDGTVLDAYTITPRVTIQSLSHGSGF